MNRERLQKEKYAKANNRPYREFDDLLEIEGIGRATVETLRRHARLMALPDQTRE